MYNKTRNANETRTLILDGVETMDGTVGSTLGPGGRPVIIQGVRGMPIVITKDGVSVAKAINYEDPNKQLAIDLITQAANDANSRGGDGTTTCTILTCSIIRSLLKLEEYETIVTAHQIRDWLRTVPNQVNKYSLACKELDFLRSVTSISANGDKVLGDLIATAIHETEGKAKITVVNNAVRNDSIRRVEEAQWEARFQGVSRNVHMTNTNLSVIEGVVPSNVLNKLSKNRSCIRPLTVPLVVFCDKIEAGASAAISRLAENNIYFGVLPGIGNLRATHLNDLASIIGIETTTVEELETIEAVKMTNIKSDVVIGAKFLRIKLNSTHEAKRNKLVEELEEVLSASEADARQRKVLNSRLDIWSPNYYELDIAAVSAAERKERLDRVEDCVNASRNAYEAGVIPGGGVIGMYLIKELATSDYSDTTKQILTDLLMTPFLRITGNMGLPVELKDTVIEDFENKYKDDTLYCYDVIKNELVDCVARQVFDPVIVFESALEAAISLGLVVATTGGSIIVDRTLYHQDETSSN